MNPPVRSVDPLREPGPLVTAHQLPAVLVDRDLFLEACPGSGKTRTAAVRVARLAEDGRRVAVCSYTNTGVEELRHTLVHDVGHTLGPQHFSGTLHQFLLYYVLYPFGHLVLGCPDGPRVLGPEATSWPQVVFDKPTIRLGLQHFQFRPDGSLCIRSRPARFPYNPATALSMRADRARREKIRLATQLGWVSTDDAMYWALQVLRKDPWVAAAITNRFDEILVDEAQDTSELQLACLRALHHTGTLRSLTLVGDLDQSIYSYNGAHPDGCAQLARDRRLEHLTLRENRRCSQRICDVTARLHRRGIPDVATGPDRHCSVAPEVAVYPADDPLHAVSSFRARLSALDESPDEAVVLVRTNDLADTVNGTGSPQGVNAKALKVARLVDAQRRGATLGRRELDHLDRTLAVVAWDREDLTGETAELRWALRRATMTLLAHAPPLESDLATWAIAMRGPMSNAVATLTDQPAHKIGTWLRVTAPMRSYPVADLSAGCTADLPSALRARTVHEVKGATRSSVLLLLGRTRPTRRPAEHLGTALVGAATPMGEPEELRIAYVALTRARRFCRIALPDNTSEEVVAMFTDSGFARQTP